MVNPVGKYIFIKKHTDLGRSKILLPDNVSNESTLFKIYALGPDVLGLEVHDVVVMVNGAVAQQCEDGLVAFSEMVCAKVT